MHSFQNLLRQWLARLNPARVVEWGPGKSTSIIQEVVPAAFLLSVEHDDAWIERARELVLAPNELRHISATKRDAHYATTIFRNADAPFDFAFVDGRRRVECVLAAFAHGCPVVMLHDWCRANYKDVLLAYANVLQEADNTVVLAPKLRFPS